MSVDNRTELNDADNVTGWTDSNKAPGLNTLTGQRYEGTGAIETQHSNSDAELDTVQTSGGGGTFSLDWSDTTMYLMVKDNLVDTFANGGVQLVLGDGTDLIGYDVGGNDAVGLILSPFFNTYKIDGSQSAATPGTFAVYAGSEANLTYTTITRVGYGSLHLAKAQGNVANTFCDRIMYIANGSYALTINGGTVGTPETMADVQGDDVISGWGIIANPKGEQYDFFAPTEWGNSAATADTYFSASNEQWFWIGDNAGGRAIGANNFPFRIVGNATDITDIAWTSLVVVNTGTRAEFIIGDANTDISWDNVTLTSLGVITHAAQDIARTFDVVTHNDCDQVAPNACNGTDWVFNGAFNADGAMLLDTSGDSNNLVGVSFVSDGAGHAILITATGTYDFDNFTFDAGFTGTSTDAAVYNNSGGAVTLNVQNGGDTPSVRNGASATTTINNAVTVAVSGVAEGTSCKVIANETLGTLTKGDTIFELLADSTGTAQITDFNYESAFGAGLDVLIRARNQGLPNAAIADDNGVFVDETTNANSAALDDMNLLPVTPVVNQDRYILGHSEQFDRLKVNVSTVGTGGFTITWQYWNGAWTNLAGVTDGTSSFSTLGTNIVSFTLPGDWVTTTINGQGPFFFVRAAYTAGTVTVTPLGRSATLDVTRYLPIPPTGELVRTITSSGLTATLSQAVDSIAKFDPLND